MSFYVKCKCNQCDVTIEFPPELAGQSQTCPKCGLETLLYIPPGQQFSAPAPKKKSQLPIIVGFIMVLAIIAAGLQMLGAQSGKTGDAENAGTVIGGMLTGIILFSIGLFIYFLPAIIGRHKRNVQAIFVLNLLAGWTLIGWVIAMVWACTVDPESARQK